MRLSVRGIHGSVIAANTSTRTPMKLSHEDGYFLLGIPRILVSIATTNSDASGAVESRSVLHNHMSPKYNRKNGQRDSQMGIKSNSSLFEHFGFIGEGTSNSSLSVEGIASNRKPALQNFHSSVEAKAVIGPGSFLTSVQVVEPHILLTLETRNSLYDIADSYIKILTAFLRKSGARPDDLVIDKESNGSSVSSAGLRTPKPGRGRHHRNISITELASGELKVEDLTQKYVGDGGDVSGCRDDGARKVREVHETPSPGRLAKDDGAKLTLSQRRIDIAEASLEFSADEKASLVDIFALYITAPQINLTDNQNRGCLLLAMSGISVEGRQSKYADVETVSLTATSVQSFVAPTDIDVKFNHNRKGMWLVRADSNHGNGLKDGSSKSSDINNVAKPAMSSKALDESYRRYSELKSNFGVLKPIVPDPFPVKCVLSIHHGVDVEHEGTKGAGTQVGHDAGSAADHSKRSQMIHRSVESNMNYSVPAGSGAGDRGSTALASSNTNNDAEIKQMTKTDGILAELLLQNDVVLACNAEQFHIVLNVIVNILTPPVPKVEARLDENQRFMLQQQLKMRKKLIDSSLNASDPLSIALADQMLENEWVAKRALQWEVFYLERLLCRLLIEEGHIANDIAHEAAFRYDNEEEDIADKQSYTISKRFDSKEDMRTLMSNMISRKNDSEATQQMRKHSVLLSSVREELALRKEKLGLFS